MALIKFKSTVKVPKVVIIACAIINAANTLGLTHDIVVTSGNDSKHKVGSKHYSDEALDIRTKNIAEPHKFASTIRRRLGPDYDVILEDEEGPNEHLHCEFDPK